MARTHSHELPSYRLHKPKGLAVVRLNGRDIYLGKYGTTESKTAYERVITEWLANGKQLPPERTPAAMPTSGVSVNDLIKLVLFAPIVRFLVCGASSLEVPFQVLVYSVVVFIVIPLAVGVTLRAWFLPTRRGVVREAPPAPFRSGQHAGAALDVSSDFRIPGG